MASRLRVAELPLGSDGLNGSKNMSQVPITALIKANNITYENGTIQKEGGALKYNTTAISSAPSVLGGHDWNHDSVTQRMVVLTSAGELLKDTGGGDFTVTLDTGLTVTDIRPVFVEGGKETAAADRKLFIFTQKNAVQVLAADGASTADLATPPSDWTGATQPRFGVIHEGQLWAGGNQNEAHVLYTSKITDYEDFSDGQTTAVYPGVGEYMVGAVSFKGGLVVFKFPKGIYFVDTSDARIGGRVFEINGAIGCIGPRAFAQTENDIVYMDQSGDIRMLSATDKYGNLGTRSLSDGFDFGPFMRDNVNLARLDQIHFEYYSTKRELHIAAPGLGSSVNNLRIVLDFNSIGKVKPRVSDRDTCVSLWQRRVSGQPELVCGDDAGFVYRLDRDARTKDGAGYSAEFQTAHNNLSYIAEELATKRKNGKFLEIIFEPKGNWGLSVDIFWDAVLTQTVQFNMGTTGAALGTFILGIDKLGGDIISNDKRRITGSGRHISIAGRNSGDGQDFSIDRAYLHYKVGNQRLSN